LSLRNTLTQTQEFDVNEAEKLLRRMFNYPQGGNVSETNTDPAALIHPNAQYSLFGLTGTKELLQGRDAILAFTTRCVATLDAHRDEILAITGIDEQCALVHARAFRRSKSTGEEVSYEWAMLFRVEQGRITYGTDMLDADAQAFWGRVQSA
jgi:ketosteroid isomerase-like protein